MSIEDIKQEAIEKFDISIEELNNRESELKEKIKGQKSSKEKIEKYIINGLRNFIDETKTDFIKNASHYIDPKGRINYGLFAEHLVKKYKYHTISDSLQLLYYKDGYYHFDPKKTTIEKETQKVFKYNISNKGVNEIKGHVQRSTIIGREEINNNPWILNLENGLFNIETEEFTGHSPKYIITTKLPVKYDQSMKCPEINKFISAIVNKKDIRKLYELAGYILYRGYPIHSFFIFLGSGNNGKTTFINLLTEFIGDENVSHIPLQKLSGFLVQELYGMMMNSVGDLNSTEIKRAGDLKQLTGEDHILAAIKFSNESMKLQNYAKLVYSCNELPPTSDKSDAFYERSEVIDFPNKFSNKIKDITLLKKLITEKELSGFFNCSVKALKSLLMKGEFTGQLLLREKKHLYEHASNPIYRFINECCEKNIKEYVHKQELKRIYTEFCKREDIPMEEDKNFNNIILNTFSYIGDARRGRSGNSRPSWTGINLIGKEHDNKE